MYRDTIKNQLIKGEIKPLTIYEKCLFYNRYASSIYNSDFIDCSFRSNILIQECEFSNFRFCNFMDIYIFNSQSNEFVECNRYPDEFDKYKKYLCNKKLDGLVEYLELDGFKKNKSSSIWFCIEPKDIDIMKKNEDFYLRIGISEKSHIMYQWMEKKIGV